MSLRASLLRELENQNLSVDRRAELCCEVARDSEDRGEYEKARQALREYWRRIGEQPKLSGLEESTAAEVLLRAGVLTGYVGSKNQIEDAQESAKDLITQSHTIFEARRNRKKIAEAQTELALIYWRKLMKLAPVFSSDRNASQKQSKPRERQWAFRKNRAGMDSAEALTTHGRALAASKDTAQRCQRFYALSTYTNT